MKLNFEVVSIVLIIKYLSQNFIKLSMLGMFWNPHDKQIPKLPLFFEIYEEMTKIFKVKGKAPFPKKQ